jgi:hypothetical protein
VQIVYMDPLLDGVPTELIRRPVNMAPLHAAAG